MAETEKQLLRRLERSELARRQAEELLEQKSEELFETLTRVKSNEAILKNALESMVEGFLFLNPSNEVVVCNQQFCEIYPGLAMHVHAGSNMTAHFDLMLKHPAYVHRVLQHKGEALFVIDTTEGRTVSIGARFTQSGFIASSHRDITTVWAAENERRKLLLDVLRAQRLESIGRMSKLIAHDFNNIIAAVKGYTGFLIADLPAESDQLMNSANSIMAAACKAEDLIVQILEYGKLQELPRCDVSLIPAIEDSLDTCESIVHPGIKIEFEQPAVPYWVLVNESRLDRLFVNIITNAISGIGEDDGTLTVIVEAFNELDLKKTSTVHPDYPGKGRYSVQVGSMVFPLPSVRISILDTGCGMTPAVMGKMFELYFSTSQTKAHGGLGMSSVSDIVVDFSGGIKVTSKPGQGTAVEVVFPLSGDREVFISPEISPYEYSENDPARILLIDDDEIVGGMIKKLLQRDGYAVEYCNLSGQALNMLLKEPGKWKLIISDQMMPGLKGSEILASIRAANIETPFILCSANIESRAEIPTGEPKENFVPKPIDEQLLRAKVKALTG